MDQRLVEIAKAIKGKFLDQDGNQKVLSIFLCGGNTPEVATLRRTIGDHLTGIRSTYRYSVYYPEDMFIELILGHQRQDLLALEDLLATGVNAVAILLGSPGTFTELGAFANHTAIRQKLVVVIEPKHKRERSFINYGPIRMLKSKTSSQILYMPMDEKHALNIAHQIAGAVREISQHVAPSRDLLNPIACYDFYLAMIYIFDPIQECHIREIVTMLAGPTSPRAITVAETVLNSLVNERKMMRDGSRLSTTRQGAEALLYHGRTKKAAAEVSNCLSALRLQVLTLTLRRSKGKTGPRVAATLSQPTER